MERRQGAPIDALSGAAATISFAHHEVHEGDAFHAFFGDSSMANAETILIAFKTPPGTKRAHMTFSYGTLAGATLELVEGASWTQGTGAALAIFNHKREATMKSSMLLENRAQATFTASDEMISNVTGLSGGTAIPLGEIFGSSNSGGGQDRGVAEWPLAPDETYVVRLTAVGNSNAGSINLNWYEHTDSNPA